MRQNGPPIVKPVATGCNRSLTGLLSHSKTMDWQLDHSPEGLDRNRGPVQIGCGPVRLPVFLVFLDRTFKHYIRNKETKEVS